MRPWIRNCLILLFLPGLAWAQQTGDPGPRTSGVPEASATEDDTQRSVVKTRNRLLGRSIEILTEREVDEQLENLGLSREGSIYTRRKRLKAALGEKEDNKPDFSALAESNKKELPMVIENAAEGELMRVDKTKGGVLVLRGRVRLKLRTGALEAETISVDSDRQEIYAEGGIKFEDGRARVTGDKFIYDYKLDKGVVYNTKGTMSPAYFVGEKFKKLDDKRYMLEMGYFTSCNAEKPHYSFKVDKVTIYDDKTIIGSNVRFQVGGTTVFWLPFFYNNNLGNGWNTQMGKNNTQGLFMQNSFQWSVLPGNSWAPMGYKFRADFYEMTGQAFQTEMWRQSPNLNYQIDLGYANHKAYQIVPGYQNRFANYGLGTTGVTNEIDKGDYYGTNIPNVGVDKDPWWKGRIFLNSKTNNTEKDVTRNISIQYENYTNRLFEYEYGNRYQPNNSLQSLYTYRDVRFGYVRNTLEWKADYTENRGDLSVNVNMKRNMIFYNLSPLSKSGYFPTVDVLPSTTIKNSSEVARLPYFETPVYWDSYLTNTLLRFYGVPVQEKLKIPTLDGSYDDPTGAYRENLLRTQSFLQGETGFRTSMNFGSYISLAPAVYYGAKKQSAQLPAGTASSSTVNTNFTSLERSLARDSYQYFRTNTNLRVGAPILFFNATYRKLEAEKPELQDPILMKNRQHEVELSLESYALENFEISLRTIRDLRNFSDQYQPQPTNKERWYYTVFRFAGYIDFLEGFSKRKRSLLERKRSFYSGIFFNNDFVYHTPLGRPLSNNLTVSYKMGGFRLPFLRYIRELEMGGTWYHIYYASMVDNYRVYAKASIDITRELGFEAEIDSRVTEPWRYTNQTDNYYYQRYILNQDPTAPFTSMNMTSANFGQDLINGTGINGTQARQNTALNINRVMGTIKYNLHTMNFRLGLSSDLRSVPGGTTGASQVTFYDQSVFFSISLTDFSLGQEDSSQLTRMRLYRFKKRPLKAGYVEGVESQ
ncbi:LPS-assembly protein LptD [Leptospira langatensis]|uniref:LPS-assembly protein LptD n=1 Tax=Leptospira langatensis TaxID=2484983 RepID=A0A5F1ZXN3_9LEPT|nr:LPS-assembly protein LptD [Leptospira langatensis]TGJ98534.1 LPS-assembly protein LptD [Leptospira langatensis]TGL43448.1 LPS-assembly protein LptD [Leptospira langatensis]